VLRLLTFGGLRVAREDGGASDLSNQRRRLAVLVIVAAAAPSAVTRDRLLYLLWPDTDSDKGRHALSQIVYNLRRELGASPIDGTGDLTLVTDVMSADLLEFRAAIARSDHAAAAALFTGPFLDGFYVPGAGEFERWVEEERMRTTRQALSSIEKLVAAAAHDPSATVHWTQRLVDLDPLSARRALAHMRALEVVGERDAAIAYGRRYEVLARAEEDDVDPAVRAEVERLRALPTELPHKQPTPLPITAPVVPTPPDIVASTPALIASKVDAINATRNSGDAIVRRTAPTDADGTATDAEFDARARATASTDAGAALYRRRRWLVPTTIAALCLIGGAAAWTRRQTPTLPLGVGDRILLADVQMPDGDSTMAQALAVALQSAVLQSSHVHLLGRSAIRDALQRMQRPPTELTLPDSTAFEVAEREGARYVVALNVTSSGASGLLTLRVLEPSSRSTVQSYAATATTTALLPAIDELAARFRRDLGDSRRDIAAAIPLPRATTPSLEALKLLASGRDAFNRALYNDARALYASALAIDTGFAAAHAGIAAVEFDLGNQREGTAAITKALARADRLPPRERMLIQAEAERGRGDWVRAAILHRAYLLRYPDDYDAYEMLGYDLMKGKNPVEAIAAYDSVRAHRRLSAAALMNIGQINILLERNQDARNAFAEGLHLDTTFLIRNIENERIGTTFMRLGFADSARMVFSVMMARDEGDQARAHRSLAYVDLREGKYASAVSHLTAAIELGQQLDGAGFSEIRDRALLASVLLDLGQPVAAHAQLRTGAAVALSDPYDPVGLVWTGKPAARLGDTLTARLLLDSARARTRPTDAGQRSATTALEAELLLAQGRVAQGLATARHAVEIDSAAYLVETLAYALERAGMLVEARAKQVALSRGATKQMGKEAQQLTFLAPLAIARLDATMGQVTEAQHAVGAFMERWPTADANLPMVTSLRARIAALRRAVK
jgi:DNA-binding SARP family transcriptional activator/tetratricopeptide (TPR) repeat protein